MRACVCVCLRVGVNGKINGANFMCKFKDKLAYSPPSESALPALKTALEADPVVMHFSKVGLKIVIIIQCTWSITREMPQIRYIFVFDWPTRSP